MLFFYDGTVIDSSGLYNQTCIGDLFKLIMISGLNFLAEFAVDESRYHYMSNLIYCTKPYTKHMRSCYRIDNAVYEFNTEKNHERKCV